jgi:isopentenyldiphosphate isomerase
MDDPEEVLDLVNDHDVVIGQVSRSAFADPAHFPAGNMRAAELFIVNDRGELWVPRRSMNKKTWPGGYDFSAAEHVGTGETYEQAMLRGLQEELNLTATPDELIFLGKLPPDELPIFRAVYKLQRNEPPQYNTDDFMNFEWLTPQELLARIYAGEPVKNTVRSAVETFFRGVL